MSPTNKTMEYRKGNSVQQGVVVSLNSDSIYCYVPKRGETIFQKIISGRHYKYEEIKPIELNEQIILLVGGLKKGGQFGYLYNIKGIEFGWASELFLEYGCDSKKSVTIKYLHELQNIVYDINKVDLINQ